MSSLACLPAADLEALYRHGHIFSVSSVYKTGSVRLRSSSVTMQLWVDCPGVGWGNMHPQSKSPPPEMLSEIWSKQTFRVTLVNETKSSCTRNNGRQKGGEGKAAPRGEGEMTAEQFAV